MAVSAAAFSAVFFSRAFCSRRGSAEVSILSEGDTNSPHTSLAVIFTSSEE